MHRLGCALEIAAARGLGDGPERRQSGARCGALQPRGRRLRRRTRDRDAGHRAGSSRSARHHENVAMNPVLLEVSELLRRFAGADWRDLYVRTAHYTLFIAKAGGAPNPMLRAAAKSSAVAEQSAEYTIAAPHVGTVASIAQVGEEIEYGSSVIRLALLGETVEVRSEHAGVVTDVLAQPGDLVQYDTSLLRI